MMGGSKQKAGRFRSRYGKVYYVHSTVVVSVSSMPLCPLCVLIVVCSPWTNDDCLTLCPAMPLSWQCCVHDLREIHSCLSSLFLPIFMVIVMSCRAFGFVACVSLRFVCVVHPMAVISMSCFWSPVSRMWCDHHPHGPP